MPTCEPCKVPDTCLTFPLIFYSLNGGKSYVSSGMVFNIACPDGSTATVTLPPGTFKYTLPFPPGFVGDYPPIVMPCLSGFNVRNIPSGASQDDIDAIVDEMFQTCGRATAEAQSCPTSFTNSKVTFAMSCAIGETITFSGTLPPWITVDTGTNSLVGSAGVFTGSSTAEATATAQAALDTFAADQITLGNLFCAPPTPTIVLVNAETTGWGAEDAIDFSQVGSTLYGLGATNFYSSTDGVNWTNMGPHGVVQPQGMAAGNGVFVIIDGFLNRAFSSPNGTAWTPHGLGYTPESIAFGNGVFVVLAGLGGNASTSANGTAWIAGPGSGMTHARAIDFGLGLFVAAGQGEEISSSPDGITWTLRSAGFGNLWTVSFSNSLFVAAGNSGDVYTSPDGINWTGFVTDFFSWRSSGGGSGLFCLTASSGEVYTSTDGINFALFETEPTARFPGQTVYFSNPNVIVIGFFI